MEEQTKNSPEKEEESHNVLAPQDTSDKISETEPSPPIPHDAGTQKSTSNNVVLQWVSYALWEGVLIVLSTLLSATLTYFMVKTSSDYSFVVYFLAATLCLLPLAFVADRMFRKQEPEQKHGFAGVVLVLNAILVFIVTVGGLITAVVSGIMQLVDTQVSSATTITMISALVVTILGGLLFIRILNPPKLQRLTRLFPIITGLTLAGMFAGPLKHQLTTRDDRFIEDNLYIVDQKITQYTDSHKRLPDSLSALGFDTSYDEGAKALVDRKLVRYTPNSRQASQTTELQGSTTTYHYRLCVTFEKQKGSGKGDNTELYSVSQSHKAGEECYDLKKEVYQETSSTTTPSSGGVQFLQTLPQNTTTY